MAVPIRNPKDAPAGAITATPAVVAKKLAVRKLPIHGIKRGGRRRG